MNSLAEGTLLLVDVTRRALRVGDLRISAFFSTQGWGAFIPVAETLALPLIRKGAKWFGNFFLL